MAGWSLKTEDGKIYPLIKDDGSRMFYKDAKLLNRPMRLTGRMLPGSQMLQVINVRSYVKGKLHEFYYWCDICTIRRTEAGICDCCLAPLDFHEVPYKGDEVSSAGSVHRGRFLLNFPHRYTGKRTSFREECMGQRTVLYDWHVARGRAWWTSLAGACFVQYTTIIEEHSDQCAERRVSSTVSAHGSSFLFGSTPDALGLHPLKKLAATMTPP